MHILNLHERIMVGSPQKMTELFRALASDTDALWPRHWPRLKMSPRLTPGAEGGHGPIRYRTTTVAHNLVRFTFTGPKGFDGYHELSFMQDIAGTRVRHLINMRVHGPALVTWPLVFEPLHDALIEDLLDNAEREMTGQVQAPARHSVYVRFLRRLTRRLAEPPRHG